MPLTFTVGGASDTKAKSLAESFKKVNERFSFRWSFSTTGVITRNQDLDALFTFDRISDNSDYLERLEKNWSGELGTSKNWISNAMRETKSVREKKTPEAQVRVEMFYNNPSWESASAVQIEKDKTGYKNISKAPSTYWDNIYLTIDNFTWCISLESNTVINSTIRAKDFYVVKFAK